jgi:hypothetical protein
MNAFLRRKDLQSVPKYTAPLVRFLPVILMLVKEASYASLERRCLLKITDGAGAVEQLPLELGGNGIPAHKYGRAQTLQDLLFFLKGSPVVAILSPLNRLIDMDCHPLFVFGKRRVGLLEIAESRRSDDSRIAEAEGHKGGVGRLKAQGYMAARLALPRVQAAVLPRHL